MKHIVKRGVDHGYNNINLPKGTREVVDIDTEFQKIKNKYDCYISTDKGDLLKSFIFEKDNKKYLIPIPDLSLVYFDAAYNLNQQRCHYEKETLVPFNNNLKFNNIDFDNIYKYYGYSSSCLITLFTSLECFINHLIPNDGIYQKNEKLFSKVFNQDQIQRGINFIDKVDQVLPHLNGKKSFFKVFPKQTHHLKNLQKLRDDIVHTKSSLNHKKQQELIRRILKFDFDKTFESVKDFMNYYKTDFIEECKCGIDY